MVADNILMGRFTWDLPARGDSFWITGRSRVCEEQPLHKRANKPLAKLFQPSGENEPIDVETKNSTSNIAFRVNPIQMLLH
jgi:hypothetical protein